MLIPHLVTAIANYTTRVVDTGLSAAQRQEALKFLGSFLFTALFTLNAYLSGVLWNSKTMYIHLFRTQSQALIERISSSSSETLDSLCMSKLLQWAETLLV